MKLDDNKLREALSTIHGAALSPADAATIVDVARFAASVDGRMDMKEMATIARLAKIVYAMSGQPAPAVPSTPVSAEWMRDLDKRLTAKSTRELAFAAAYLIVMADGQLLPQEGAFGGALSAELSVAPERAKELTTIIDGALAG